MTYSSFASYALTRDALLHALGQIRRQRDNQVIREVVFLHTSSYSRSIEFYTLVDGIWQNVDFDSPFANIIFALGEIKSVVDWS